MSPGISTTSVTPAPVGPTSSARRNRSNEDACPPAATSTSPLERFVTHPLTPSRRASSRTNQRNPTPCTRPLMRTWSRCTLLLLPSLRAVQRHESHGRHIARLDRRATASHELERLLLLRADGHQHPS